MNRRYWSFGLTLSALLLPGAVAVGCGGNSTAPANTAGGSASTFPLENTAEEEQGPAAEAVRTFHRHHHIGFIGFALVSIPSLGLPPAEEAQVEKIRADIKTKFQPANDAEAALLNTLADGVAAGTLDQAKLDAAIAKMNEVSTQMDDVTNDDLTQLHNVLTPPERQALVLKVQANYMLWERANADQAAQPDQEQEGGHIAHLAKVLALTPDQVQKIDAGFTAAMASVFAAKKFDSAAAEAHLNAFVDGFTSDHFDAKTLTSADRANSGVTSWGAARMVKMYEVMTPVLTPDQRTKLAALLREHATKQELN
ncbi:MAG TPA: periplasmic heavy metal sensor [Polyangiaceae bacterium]|jgi:Spy/CpxP family protein refolding chaperone